MAKRKPMSFPNIEGAGTDQYWVYITPSTAYLYSISPADTRNRKIGDVWLDEHGEVKYRLDEYVDPDRARLPEVVKTVQRNVADAVARRIANEVLT